MNIMQCSYSAEQYTRIRSYLYFIRLPQSPLKNNKFCRVVITTEQIRKRNQKRTTSQQVYKHRNHLWPAFPLMVVRVCMRMRIQNVNKPTDDSSLLFLGSLGPQNGNLQLKEGEETQPTAFRHECMSRVWKLSPKTRHVCWGRAKQDRNTIGRNQWLVFSTEPQASVLVSDDRECLVGSKWCQADPLNFFLSFPFDPLSPSPLKNPNLHKQSFSIRIPLSCPIHWSVNRRISEQENAADSNGPNSRWAGSFEGSCRSGMVN